MEKRIWSKPEMNEFAFAANEYVAACGDSGKRYLFDCDAPGGTLYWFGNMVNRVFNALRVNSSEKPDFDDYDTQRIGDYNPCSKKHETEATSDFFWGFIDYNKNGRYDYSEDKDDDETVIVWRNWESGWWGSYYNAHATKDLDMSTWETAKS